MDVKIADYGIIGDKCFILYNISGLTNNQLEFLNNNLDDETRIVEDNLLLKTEFVFIQFFRRYGLKKRF